MYMFFLIEIITINQENIQPFGTMFRQSMFQVYSLESHPISEIKLYLLMRGCGRHPLAKELLCIKHVLNLTKYFLATFIVLYSDSNLFLPT